MGLLRNYNCSGWGVRAVVYPVFDCHAYALKTFNCAAD